MKSRLSLLSLSVLLLFFTACENSNEPTPVSKPNVRQMKAAETALLTSSNNFCFDYFKLLAETEKSQNSLFSPYSAHTALSMLLHGADGVTKQEIKDALRIPTQSDDEVKSSFKTLKEYLLQVDPSVTLNIANSIWARQGYSIGEKFSATMKDYYQADVTSLDFDNPTSLKTINGWVNQQTNGRIPTILDKLNAEDMMVLLNAVYFKSDWKTKFDASKTVKSSFTKDDKTVIQVDMMQSDKMEAWHYSDSQVQFVDIPFGNGAYSFSVLMPQGSQSLDAFVASFTNEKWQQIVAKAPKLSDSIGQIQLKMPRFKFEYEHKMIPLLQTLGMNLVFTDQAELPYLFANNMNLSVSSVKQKAFIQVDEKGGEAAAVTSIVVGVTSIGANFVTIDRPFMFIIRERNSNSILFIGKVHSPTF